MVRFFHARFPVETGNCVAFVAVDGRCVNQSSRISAERLGERRIHLVEMLVQDTANLSDEFGISLATMSAADDQFRLDVIQMGTGIFDNTIPAG